MKNRTNETNETKAFTLAFTIAASALLGGACVDDQGSGEVELDRIINGKDTDITTVPWQVSVRTSDTEHNCGGSIIAPGWILTAAHCEAPGTVWAGTGDRNSAPQKVKINKWHIHDWYNSSTNEYDVALLELESPLELNESTVKKISLATCDAGEFPNGTDALVSGWGVTHAESKPNKLQSVIVPILDDQSGISAYGSEFMPESMLAAGGNGVDSCQGDSGGPLAVDWAGSNPLLVGVVSWGYGCAEAPGVYARVPAPEVLDWIEQETSISAEHDACGGGGGGGGGGEPEPPPPPGPGGDGGSCCDVSSDPGCGDAGIKACVCAEDDYCCTTEWDDQCVAEVEGFGCGTCGGGAPPPPPPPPPPPGPGGGGGDCCDVSGSPGCSDAGIQACVCAQDDYCCTDAWDDLCVDEVEEFGCGSCG